MIHYTLVFIIHVKFAIIGNESNLGRNTYNIFEKMNNISNYG